MNIHDLIYKKTNPRLVGIVECYVDYDKERTVDPRKIIQFLKSNPIYTILTKTADRLDMEETHRGSLGTANLEVEFASGFLNHNDPQAACQQLLKMAAVFRKTIDDYTHSLEVMGLEHGVAETYVIPKLSSPDVEDGDVAWAEHVDAIAAGEMTLDQAIDQIQNS